MISSNHELAMTHRNCPVFNPAPRTLVPEAYRHQLVVANSYRRRDAAAGVGYRMGCASRMGLERMVTTVFIVDDHPLLLHGLENLIARDPGYRVVGSALDGRSAVTRIRQDLPDIAVIDLNMPGFSGLDVAVELGKEMPATRCVMLTAGASQGQLYDVVMAGVAGIVLKESAVGTLLRCIDQVAAGGHWLPAEIIGEALEIEASRRIKWQKLSSRLTRRELEIARLVATDKPYERIALDIGISKGTLKIHMNNIYRKLEVSSRAQLLQLAAGQTGLNARIGSE
ncbi:MULTISPECIES: response regulator transcription factor [unclassified Mesorhizobium]|uniref:response regulator n=1 Tax=unclassified Mesorhizobium TaxID=325217 RepID=UPI000BB0BA7B|nr:MULTISPECIES: response regulator transcription factor [unclassified Mesorhizobium]PBB23455.1 DNA-binding response regulator [Mesorhizobium sp. WSM4304]PBB72302.1 DNA-binding response regulator [Mesorhizobium sp. WSM4308]